MPVLLGIATGGGAIVYILCAFLFWKFTNWLESKRLITFDGFAYLPEWFGVLSLMFLFMVWPLGLIIVLGSSGVTLLLALTGEGAHYLFAHIIASNPRREGSSLCKIYSCRMCCCRGHSSSVVIDSI